MSDYDNSSYQRIRRINRGAIWGQRLCDAGRCLCLYQLPFNAQSIFYNQPLAPALCIAFATIIMLLVSSAIAYKAFKNHQTAN